MRRGGGWEKRQRTVLTESKLLRLPDYLPLIRVQLENVPLLLLRRHLKHRNALLQDWRDSGVRARRRLRDGRDDLMVFRLEEVGLGLLGLFQGGGFREGCHPGERCGEDREGIDGGAVRRGLRHRRGAVSVMNSWPRGEDLGLGATMALPPLGPRHRR